MDEILQPEDIGLCESVQKGLRSKGYNQGRFVIDESESELSEHGVHHFQELLLDALERSRIAGSPFYRARFEAAEIKPEAIQLR